MKNFTKLLLLVLVNLAFLKVHAQTTSELCFVSSTGNPAVSAKMSTSIDQAAGTATVRITFAKTFVDNTYGVNSIGWGGKGHQYKDLVGSDHVQMAMYNGNKTKVLEFKLDYITASSTVPSGYKTLGVYGGDGKMIVGSSSNIVNYNTSLDQNFNNYGYVLTTNSPATNSSYTPNTSYPNWIFDVWYEVTVKLSAFGSSSYGSTMISSVHASPSKTGKNSEPVDSTTCSSTSNINLGNLVWNDVNGNGIRETGEAGVGGVTVKLYRDQNADNVPDNNTPVATTTTSQTGNYNFTSLAEGNYIVGIIIPSGYTNSPTHFGNPNDDKDNDNNGINVINQSELRTNYITLKAGTEPINDGDGNNGNLSVDLAICGRSNLGDFVWNDVNNNGVQDVNEAGIANAAVTLTYPDGTQKTVTTDANGKYLFVNLGPGIHTVTFTSPSGYGPSPSNAGTDDTKDSDPVNGNVTVSVLPNVDNLTVDAGFFSGAVSVGNLVWNDWNGNGIKEAGEPGIGGVTVRLYKDFNGDNKVDNNTPIASTNTDGNGNYLFANLAPGKYIVGVVIPSGYTIPPTHFDNPNDDRDNDNNGTTVINQSELRSNFITLASGTEPTNDGDGNNSNLTLDIALCGRSDIGDFVWNDYNNNGIQDAGEPGIANAVVTLTFPDGTTASTTSDANGNYYFKNLGPGTHTVSFTTPAGFNPSPANQGSDDAKDSDADNGEVTVVITATVNNFTIDAGFTKPGIVTLGNLVWNDWNGNGLKEPGEPGVADVTVRLYRDNNGDNIPDGAPIATTSTDPQGYYTFTGLNDGKYIVGIVIPSGYTITGTSFNNPNDDRDNDNNGVNVINQSELRTNYITLVAGTEPINDGDGNNGNLTLDLAICGRGSIGDFVWDDKNANGIQDAGEPGIAGVTVTLLFPDDVTSRSVVTDANGKYLFVNLGPGTHKVSFSTPSGYSPSPANQGGDDAKDSDPENGSVLVTLFPQEDNLNIDAGFTRGTPTLSLGNFVWNDSDGDGKRDPNEYGIGGITVKLYRDDNSDNQPDGAAVATTQTNNAGYYSFTGLTNGRYITSIPILAGYRQGGVLVGSSETPDNDVDNDNNGINIVAGEEYSNAITLQAGTEPTTDGDGSNGNTTLDLALCGNSWIGDFVWNDLNGDGIQDAGEPGINGVEVRLTAPDGTVKTVNTYIDPVKGAGYYEFPRIGPGTFTVTFVTPAGYGTSPALQGGDRAKDSNPENGSATVTLAPNQSDFTIDAGFIQPGDLTLGNLVWNDWNRNGFRDANEPGVSDVTVRLYRDNNSDNLPDGGAIATTITTVGGFYSFNNLNKGRYIVDLIIPTGYTVSPTHFDNPDDDVDNDNNGTYVINQAIVRSNAITLVEGTEPTNDGDGNNGNLTLDLAICGRSKIGDFVWFDYNNNGIQQAGEPGLPGVKVTLTFEDGTQATVVSDANGKYEFINLGPGTYTLEFKTPLGYTPSPANQGSDDTLDSDPINGTVTVTLGPVEVNNTIDAGYWDDIDDDDDGILDVVENNGYDALKDCDGDGIPNYLDPTPGCTAPSGTDIYGHPFKPLVWSDCNNDGVNDFFDFDRDGIINELDLDSDNDGILDIQEARDVRAVDANNDGMADGADSDGDGLKDSADATPNQYGGPGLTPEDLDKDGLPNYTDLDSDGDGLSDITEALEKFVPNGVLAGIDSDKDGVIERNSKFGTTASDPDYAENADNIYGMGAKGIVLKDRDNDGKPNPYDIDSDNDGITDNVEGQPTCSEKQPTGVDADNDGLDDAYDTNINECVKRATGITPYDKDADGIPDMYDLDTDGDLAPDVNEGSGIAGNFVTQTGDADGDGLMDQFDIFNIKTATTASEPWRNVVHGNMGANGSFDGPTPAGSNAGLPQSVPGDCSTGADRDWRNISLLPVTLVDFKGNMSTGKVNLTWTVAKESNMSHYIVERSVNGSTYTGIGKVNATANNASGNTNYGWNDDITNLTNVTVYYRLKQVDKGGTTKLSNILTFKLSNKAGYSLGIHPNPATSYFTVKVNSLKDGMATIRVTDFAGRTVITQNNRLAIGTNAITFNNLNNIMSGTYNVQVMINGAVMNERLVVVK